MKIYYAGIVGLTEEERNEALALLPQVRIDKIEKSKSEKNQMESITAGLLLEYALQERGISGKDLTFLKNEEGKPYLKEYPEICYNLSHSGDYVALAVDEQPVGIDIEKPRKDKQKLVRRFFSEEEAKALEEQWSDALFTKLWTRKESFIKAVGLGMRMPLEGFSTLGEQVKINEKMPAEMMQPDEMYYLASFPLKDGYWLSVCGRNQAIEAVSAEAAIAEAAGDDGGPVEVDLKRIMKRV